MTKYPNTLIYFESTRNSFLEGKILWGIQFMIWCWEVIRRFLSLKIPAPKLKRPQCMAPPRRGPSLTFSNSYWAHSLFCKTLQGRLLGIGMSHNCMDPYLSVNCFLFRCQSSETFDAWPISLDIFICPPPTINCVRGRLWWVIIISYQANHNFLSRSSESATLKRSRHFHNKSLLSLLTSYSQAKPCNHSIKISIW